MRDLYSLVVSPKKLVWGYASSVQRTSGPPFYGTGRAPSIRMGGGGRATPRSGKSSCAPAQASSCQTPGGPDAKLSGLAAPAPDRSRRPGLSYSDSTNGVSSSPPKRPSLIVPPDIKARAFFVLSEIAAFLFNFPPRQPTLQSTNKSFLLTSQSQKEGTSRRRCLLLAPPSH